MRSRVTASQRERVTASGSGRVTASTRRATSADPVGPRQPSRAHPFRRELRTAVTAWLSDGKAQGWSQATILDRQSTMDRFCWWLEHVAQAELLLVSLDPDRIRQFLTYVREPNPTGRFGSNRARAKEEARPATVNAYFRILRAFSNWCLAEGYFRETPLKNVKAPKIPTDQIKPLNREQVQAMIDAARRSQAPTRNAAILLLLVDSGMRASEILGLVIGSVDRGSGELTVRGKGNKKRQVYLGANARRALWRYLDTERPDAQSDEPLFIGVGGHQPGTGMTHTGLYEVVRNAGELAGLQGVRCSPHSLRHSFAVNFLRGGGNLFELQQLMGHTDLTVLRRYVALSESDLAQAHRQASPADRMKLR